MIPFTHLHVHTQYSILDGASSVPLLLKKAKENNMSAVAITDHGNLFGAKHFYDTARANGLKPIIGCEVYVSKNSRLAKAEKSDRGGNHLILLAKNKLGYQNLSKLVSMAWIEGHYYKPRIDKDLLEKYAEGLIASSACLGGEVPQAILKNDEEGAEESVLWFNKLFGEDYYLELQRHKTGDPEMDSDTFTKQEKVNKKLVELAKKHDIKLVATNDVHFINEEDAEAHDRLICLNTGKDLDDPNRLRYTQQEWFKTQEEMNELFSDIPEALENTMEVAAKISDYELDRTPIMPDFPIPGNFKDADEYLRHITFEGAKERYEEITDEINERIDFELSVIKKMGYPGYFLIVHEVLKAAREMVTVDVSSSRGGAFSDALAHRVSRRFL